MLCPSAKLWSHNSDMNGNMLTGMLNHKTNKQTCLLMGKYATLLVQKFRHRQFDKSASVTSLGCIVVQVTLIVVFTTNEPPRGKTNNVVSEQVRYKPGCTSTEDG